MFGRTRSSAVAHFVKHTAEILKSLKTSLMQRVPFTPNSEISNANGRGSNREDVPSQIEGCVAVPISEAHTEEQYN